MPLESMRQLEPIKVLILGESGDGKTTSLDGIPEPEGVLYIELDSKGINFENSPYKVLNIKKATDNLMKMRAAHANDPENPYRKVSPTMHLANMIEMFASANKKDGSNEPLFHTIIVDTFSYLMTLFELDIKDIEYTNKTQSGKKDGQANWGDYKDYVSETLLRTLSGLRQHVFCLNHINKDTGVAEVAGAWKHKTVESSFQHILRAKKLEGGDFNKLKMKINNDLLTYTQEENYYMVKHVFKVLPHPNFENLTEKTPRGMFKVVFDETGESDEPIVNEAFMNNSIMDYLNRWYEFKQKSVPFNPQQQ